MHATGYIAAALEAAFALALFVALVCGIVGLIRSEIRDRRAARYVAAFKASPEWVAARQATALAWATVNANRNANGYARAVDMDAYRAASRLSQRMIDRAHREARAR